MPVLSLKLSFDCAGSLSDIIEQLGHHYIEGAVIEAEPNCIPIEYAALWTESITIQSVPTYFSPITFRQWQFVSTCAQQRPIIRTAEIQRSQRKALFYMINHQPYRVDGIASK